MQHMKNFCKCTFILVTAVFIVDEVKELNSTTIGNAAMRQIDTGLEQNCDIYIYNVFVEC